MFAKEALIARIVLSMLPVVVSGCTHIQLRNNTLHQAEAVHQLQQRQVLDNLAMFAANPNSVPFFTIVGAATSAVSDTGSASSSLSWLRTGFQSVGLMLGVSRLNQENFTLAPVSDPDKLARMRCAYQAAVGYGGNACIDCCSLEKKWGTKRWDGRPGPGDPAWQCPNECVPHPGWYCVGFKKDVPKDACAIGSYCDTYVWISPAGSDQLARLTFMILDYATGTAPASSKKTVKTSTKYDANGVVVEKTVEETADVPTSIGGATGNFESDAPMGTSGMDSSPRRENYFFPTPLPPVVIPLR